MSLPYLSSVLHFSKSFIIESNIVSDACLVMKHFVLLTPKISSSFNYSILKRLIAKNLFFTFIKFYLHLLGHHLIHTFQDHSVFLLLHSLSLILLLVRVPMYDYLRILTPVLKSIFPTK